MIIPIVTKVREADIDIYENNNIYRTGTMGDSLTSPYVPFISVFKGKVLKFEEDIKVLYYHLYLKSNPPYNMIDPGTVRGGRVATARSILPYKYEHLYRYLNDYLSPAYFVSGETIVQAAKGMLCYTDPVTHEYSLLMMLGVKSDYLWKINKDRFDYSKFALFVAPQLSEDDKFTTLHNKLKKEWFVETQAKGIDIIHTNSIEKWCYQTCVNKPKFATLDDMQKHLSQINQSTLYG